MHPAVIVCLSSLQFGIEVNVQKDAAKGHIIHLHEPEEGATVVNSGVAVIDTGPFTGQRVEFESQQCKIFGHALGRSDLSLLFKFGKRGAE